MTTGKRVRLTLLMLGVAWAAPGLAQEETPPSRVEVPADLLAVITLRGKPCGEVVRHERLGADDYLVQCASGHRYRVYVNPQGRVVVESR
ncbi:MAG: hypothetical protein OEM49_14335 [Myxococcales bacterium]|nr:hypothetical protein [Myxococcales bacterium]MDH5305554.1 hypothetical protein [Myxococcales bacterium]MDH5565205.1 hypothetical protein [Myxococcales bacterium]